MHFTGHYETNEHSCSFLINDIREIKEGKNMRNKQADRIGERRISNSGLEMEIITYRNARDIDVKFPNGTVALHRRYSTFLDGAISPVAKTVDPNKLKESRIGEKVISNSGLEMEIIDYRGSHDIDVRFSDGTIVEHKGYYEFKKGSISPVKLGGNRLGEKIIANCGLEMEIISYRNASDIDVRFSDGVIVEHKPYTAFQQGKIANPHYYDSKLVKAQKRHVGERNQNVCGLWMEIVAYRGSKDMDIRFDDGTIVTGKTYGSFKNGNIPNPNQPTLDVKKLQEKQRILGERRQNTLGLWMEIIEYRSSTDIDVRFDDGAVVEHKEYYNFITGYIGHPTITQKDMHVWKGKAKYEGMIKKASNGMRMRLVTFRTSHDVDIEFEDGTIVKNKFANCFIAGRIAHPYIGHGSNHQFYGVRTLDKLAFRDGNVHYYCLFPDGEKDICTPQEIMKRMDIPAVF